MNLFTAGRNAAVDGVTALLDGGGTVEFQTAATAVAAVCPLNATAFAPANLGDGVMNTSPIPEDSNATGHANPITRAVWKTSGGTEVWDNTVSGSGGSGEIKFSTANDIINPGAVVQLTGFTYTQPAL